MIIKHCVQNVLIKFLGLLSVHSDLCAYLNHLET